MTHVVHVVTGLGLGGAEMMLYKVLAARPANHPIPTVISLMDKGELAPRIESLGIPVYSLGMRRARPSPLAWWRLIRLLQELKPAAVQGWMYHGNIAASMAAPFVRPRPVVLWNVRQSLYSLDWHKPLTRWLILAGARLSGSTAVVLFNSHLSARQHQAIGYRVDRSDVIPNGFDLTTFRPDPEARIRVRTALTISPDVPVVGLIARWHPQKDHASFLDAADRVLTRFPDAVFVLAGPGIDRNNPALAKLIGSRRARDSVRLLGAIADTPALIAAFDVACLSSVWGEGFPNVLGEAMCCGVPCVATDIGDSRWILGEAGQIVAPRDPSAFADAIVRILELSPTQRAELGNVGRNRVLAQFDIREVAERYWNYYGQWVPPDPRSTVDARMTMENVGDVP